MGFRRSSKRAESHAASALSPNTGLRAGAPGPAPPSPSGSWTPPRGLSQADCATLETAVLALQIDNLLVRPLRSSGILTAQVELALLGDPESIAELASRQVRPIKPLRMTPEERERRCDEIVGKLRDSLARSAVDDALGVTLASSSDADEITAPASSTEADPRGRLRLPTPVFADFLWGCVICDEEHSRRATAGLPFLGCQHFACRAGLRGLMLAGAVNNAGAPLCPACARQGAFAGLEATTDRPAAAKQASTVGLPEAQSAASPSP